MAFEINCTRNYQFKSAILHSESTLRSTQKYIV